MNLKFEEIFNRATTFYLRNPLAFVFYVASRYFLVFLSRLALLAIFFLSMLFFSTFSIFYSFNILPYLITAVILSLVFLLFWAAFKGGFLVAIKESLNNKNISFFEFVRLSFSKAIQFAAILFLEIFVYLLVLGVLFFILSPLNKSLLELILFIVLFLVLIAPFNFIFTFSYIIAASKNQPLISTLKETLLFIKNNFVLSLIYFLIFSFSKLLFLVPLVNFLSFFLLYPITYLSLFILYTNSAR